MRTTIFAIAASAAVGFIGGQLAADGSGDQPRPEQALPNGADRTTLTALGASVRMNGIPKFGSREAVAPSFDHSSPDSVTNVRALCATVAEPSKSTAVSEVIDSHGFRLVRETEERNYAPGSGRQYLWKRYRRLRSRSGAEMLIYAYSDKNGNSGERVETVTIPIRKRGQLLPREGQLPFGVSQDDGADAVRQKIGAPESDVLDGNGDGRIRSIEPFFHPFDFYFDDHLLQKIVIGIRLNDAAWDNRNVRH